MRRKARSSDPPSQSHSDTSVGSARELSRKRLLAQERWVYEALQRANKADWELFEMVRHLGIFDQISSLRRARIGLLWRSRALGATPWHPVEDSGQRNKSLYFNRPTVIWRLKERYRDTSYDKWVKEFRNLAKGKLEDEPA